MTGKSSIGRLAGFDALARACVSATRAVTSRDTANERDSLATTSEQRQLPYPGAGNLDVAARSQGYRKVRPGFLAQVYASSSIDIQENTRNVLD
jgi:hypothetical protein